MAKSRVSESPESPESVDASAVAEAVASIPRAERILAFIRDTVKGPDGKPRPRPITVEEAREFARSLEPTAADVDFKDRNGTYASCDGWPVTLDPSVVPGLPLIVLQPGHWSHGNPEAVAMGRARLCPTNGT